MPSTPGLLKLTIAAVALIIAACSDTTLGTFSVDETTPTAELRSIGLQIPVSNLSVSIPLDITTQEAYNSGDYDYVTYVKILSLALEIDPSSDSDSIEDGNLDDFDFLTALDVYLQATFDGTERTELVASVPEGDPQYASGARVLNLTPTNIDIFDFVEATGGYKMLLTVSGTTPIDAVIVKGRVRYRVGVGFQ